tara:strand:- start:1424 stop:2035 length:612 start_codon:yes stop_codon:yes gene_type:complete
MREFQKIKYNLKHLYYFFVLVILLTGYGCHSDKTDPSPPLSKEDIISYLELEKHIEGGFFRRTYESKRKLKIDNDSRDRLSLTSIFYLLTSDSSVGHFHLNKSDIVHYYHIGDPIIYYLISPDGQLTTHKLGNNLQNNEDLQLTVPGGTWKASQLALNGKFGYGLVSEAVSPGFEYIDMQLGNVDDLVDKFPQHKKIIQLLTK